MTEREKDVMAEGLLRVLRRLADVRGGVEPSFLAGASYQEPRR